VGPPELDLVPVRRALFSVSDATGLAAFGRALAARGVELWATEGTREGLTRDGVSARPAEELTGIGSWFGGRIKTLHPGLLGGILAPRTPDGRAELERRSLREIDLVAVNFYPFAQRAGESPRSPDLEESIDIGGVTLARAAAKNHRWVAVASDAADYPEIARELEARSGALTGATRRALAARTFERIAEYDGRIARSFETGRPPNRTGAAPSAFPPTLSFALDPEPLRYGENPHQPAAAFRVVESDGGATRTALAPWPYDRLKGDALSYTNLLDLDAALAIVAEFPVPSAAVVKHASPCGVASGSTVREALARAIETDPVARYGAIIAVNRPFAAGDEDPLHGVFVDLLAAPEVSSEAREILGRRPKLKLVRATPPSLESPRWEARSALGRLLVQEADRRELAPSEFRLVTRRTADPKEACSLDFAWRVVRHARSNAVVLAHGSATVGIGSGQPTRVKAVELAAEVAGERARGSVLASDAFFPFPDGIEAAGRAGVRAVLQPGGSIRDAEVIASAERYDMAMYHTGWRVFRH
jgi:phosphoribosylaminoimidazolecarboxamide formyltransferase/IMP cyclohydrolase